MCIPPHERRNKKFIWLRRSCVVTERTNLMICPDCNSEYVEGIYTCPDCGVKLVDYTPPNENIHDNSLQDVHFISVYTPLNSQEVAIIKMILERENIPHYIKNDRLQGAVLFSIQGPGKMEVFVPEDYAQQTIDLLAEELGHE